MHDGGASGCNLLFPGEVVMIVHVRHWLQSQSFREVQVDLFVTGTGIVACQVHAHPVFLSFFRVQVEPGKMLRFMWQFADFTGYPAVMHGNSCSKSARTGM